LVTQGRPQSMYGGQARHLARNVVLNLAYPANTGKKIARLRGQIQTTVAVKSETLNLDLPVDAPAPQKGLAAMSVQIRSVAPVPNGAEARVTVLLKRPLKDMEHEAIWNTLSRIELIDADGNRYLSSGVASMGAGGQSMDATVRFFSQKKIGKLARLTWPIPVETREIRLPFEFKDLPIP
jgi:hypothetical protein